ncbi:hypothetical protein [Fodinicola feengrottensis]|uniref:Uncharacterized protein n=1 Tax=Fodinicola feengrottensis TaxID=435914 RepID=A0ABP4UZ20_9ACTN|nr:hypothetical protein [Fodinicola feengrottensis]
MDWSVVIPPLIGAGAGALLNGLISTGVALYVSRKGRQHAERLAETGRGHTELLARKQAALAAAEAIGQALAALDVSLRSWLNWSRGRSLETEPDTTQAWTHLREIVMIKPPAIDEPILIHHVIAGYDQAAAAFDKAWGTPQIDTVVDEIMKLLAKLGGELADYRRSGSVPELGDPHDISYLQMIASNVPPANQES